MYRRCITEDAASRQRQVEECLLANMFRMPYPDISITHLCQQVGISRKAFYRYYSSKDACLCALLDRTLMERRLFEIPEKVTHFDAPLEIASFLAFWRQKKDLLDVLIQNNLVDKLVSRAILYVVNEEQRTTQFPESDDFIYDDDVQLFALSGIIATIIRWHSSGYIQTDEEMVQKMPRLLLKPLMYVQSE